MDSFIVFVIVVVVWLALGMWGATLLTRKAYFKPENLAAGPHATFGQRMPTAGIAIQYLPIFLGPLVLFAVLLPKKSATR
jgi:hypothetical protein